MEIFNKVKEGLSSKKDPKICAFFILSSLLLLLFLLWDIFGHHVWFIWNGKRNIIHVSMASCTSCCWCHPWRSRPPTPTQSLVLESSQKQRHAGKLYTIRRAGHEMSLCTCVILGGRDSVQGLSDPVPYYPPHVHHGTAAAYKTKTILPIDKESQSCDS